MTQTLSDPFEDARAALEKLRLEREARDAEVARLKAEGAAKDLQLAATESALAKADEIIAQQKEDLDWLWPLRNGVLKDVLDIRLGAGSPRTVEEVKLALEAKANPIVTPKPEPPPATQNVAGMDFVLVDPDHDPAKLPVPAQRLTEAFFHAIESGEMRFHLWDHSGQVNGPTDQYSIGRFIGSLMRETLAVYRRTGWDKYLDLLDEVVNYHLDKALVTGPVKWPAEAELPLTALSNGVSGSLPAGEPVWPFASRYSKVNEQNRGAPWWDLYLETEFIPYLANNKPGAILQVDALTLWGSNLTFFDNEILEAYLRESAVYLGLNAHRRQSHNRDWGETFDRLLRLKNLHAEPFYAALTHVYSGEVGGVKQYNRNRARRPEGYWADWQLIQHGSVQQILVLAYGYVMDVIAPTVPGAQAKHIRTPNLADLEGAKALLGRIIDSTELIELPNASARKLGLPNGLRIAAWPHNWSSHVEGKGGHSTVYTGQLYPVIAALHDMGLTDHQGRAIDTETIGAYALAAGLVQLPKGNTTQTVTQMGGHRGGKDGTKNIMLIDGSVPYYSERFSGGALKEAHDLSTFGGSVIPYDPTPNDEVIRRWLWRSLNETVKGVYSHYDVTKVVSNPTKGAARFISEDLQMLNLALARPDVAERFGAYRG